MSQSIVKPTNQNYSMVCNSEEIQRDYEFSLKATSLSSHSYPEENFFPLSWSNRKRSKGRKNALRVVFFGRWCCCHTVYEDTFIASLVKSEKKKLRRVVYGKK